MSVILRPYQAQMVDSIRGAFGRVRRVLGVAPTGAGKTVLFCYISANAAAKGKRVIILAHRVEIVDQISRALDRMGIRHGRIQTGHTMTADLIQVAMVVTLGKRLERVATPDLLVVDEAHHACAGSWQSVTAAWPNARVLGVTATPARQDGKGLGDCFDEMILGPAMADLIEAGFLAGYTYLAPPQQVDLSAVKTRGGDFAVDELADAMDKAVITGDAISHYKTHLAGRPAIVFCVTVAHAESVASQFRSAGYRSASVDGKMDKTERRNRILSIGDGRLNVLTSCELISEGTDIPAVAGAILLRPTKSVGLFLQQIGRALRVKDDGGKAVILDHVGNVHRHGMPDAQREWSLDAKKKKLDAPGISTCEQCFRAFSVVPGWKAEAECAQGQPEGCVMNSEEKEIVPKAAPEIVAGELVEMTNTPRWAGGMNIATARGVDFQELLGLADTEEKLKEIAKSRKYHHGWVRRQLMMRHQHTSRAA